MCPGPLNSHIPLRCFRGVVVIKILHVCVYYCSTYYKAVREGGGGGNGGHVLRETTGMDDMCYERLVVSRRGMCGLVCPSRTSERGGEGDCVKEEGGGEGDRERERALGRLLCHIPDIEVEPQHRCFGCRESDFVLQILVECRELETKRVRLVALR